MHSVCTIRFNSRAREGRDKDYHIYSVVCTVSIHAPARGATKFKRERRQRQMFQFTRPRGARRELDSSLKAFNSFNSRAREGRDWQQRIRVWAYHYCFNSRAREGRDCKKCTPCTPKFMFQFTRPRGARQYMGLSIYFSAFATIFLRNTKNFYSLYCIFHIFLRNLLNINMCESPGFFCALGVRLRKFALLFYHRLQVR